MFGFVECPRENDTDVADGGGTLTEQLRRSTSVRTLSPTGCTSRSTRRRLDATILAMAHTVPIAHFRIRILSNPETNGRNTFVASIEDDSSGLMTVEYVVAGRDRRDPGRGTARIRRHPGALPRHGGLTMPPSPPAAPFSWRRSVAVLTRRTGRQNSRFPDPLDRCRLSARRHGYPAF